jgi:septum formation protein
MRPRANKPRRQFCVAGFAHLQAKLSHDNISLRLCQSRDAERSFSANTYSRTPVAATPCGHVSLTHTMADLPQLVLASTSPYRRELLERLRLPFVTAAPDVEEFALPGEVPEVTADRLAQAKAEAVRVQFPEAIIIGCDQVAAVGSTILGKPGNREQAVRQLELVSGRGVQFWTALCVLNAGTGRVQRRVVPVAVEMRELTPGRIERYLTLEQPYDCAGSAKIEGLGIALVRSLECADPTALIGLPLISLCDMLQNEGIAVV